MPTVPMPSTTIWDQYAVAAIVFVVFFFMLLGAYRVFKEYRAWQTVENAQQRTWYEAMEKKRDDGQLERDLKWQQFYAQIQDHQAKRDRDNNEILNKLINRIDTLTDSITQHDRKSADRFEGLTEVVRKKRAP